MPRDRYAIPEALMDNIKDVENNVGADEPYGTDDTFIRNILSLL